MPLGDDYATLVEFKAWIKDTQLDDDDVWSMALAAASRGIEKVCRRQFNKEVAATARDYRPQSCGWVDVDDFHTATDLVVTVDDALDGSFSTTLTAADYQLEPLNGVVDGVPGWPYGTVRLIGGASFPVSERATVRVTAQWGWASVPPAVKSACLVAAAELGKMKDAPFGVAGFDQWGAVRIRDNPMVMAKLSPYVRHPVLVG